MELEPFTEISRATLRTFDVAQALLPCARRYLDSWPHSAALSDLESLIDSGEDYVSTSPDGVNNLETVDDVIYALQEFCPPYCTIGMHEGDGSLLGVWPDVENAIECEPNFSDGAEIPTDYVGLAIVVNCHGNVTLLNCLGPDESGNYCQTVEIWACV